MQTISGYRATKADDGTIVVHDVPIFAECERGDLEFDRDWVMAAAQEAREREAEGYWPPLHLRHHEKGPDGDAGVEAAGYFRVTRTGMIQLQGESRLAIYADLHFTNPVAAELVMSKRYPYRSVEIFSMNRPPKIDGLALLDHEAPFLELPMLMVSRVSEGVPSGNFGSRVTLHTYNRGTLAASFQRGDRAHLLFREDDMADEYDEKDKKDDGENMEAAETATIDAAAIIAAIEDGSISVADFEAIQAAMDARKGPAEEVEAEEPAESAAPIEMMKREMTPEMAAMQGQVRALEAKLQAREKAEQRAEDVAEALERLDGRPLGADIKDQLLAFHRDHGREAFRAYVGSLEKHIGILPDLDRDGVAFSRQSGVPDVAMKYTAQGPAAVEEATRLSRIYDQQNGRASMSRERFIELGMERLASRN